MVEENIDLLKLEELINQLLENGEVTHGFGRALCNLSKEIFLYKNFIESKKSWKGNPGNLEKIQIGGGKHILEGFINIDIVPPADLIWDAREGLPIPDDVSSFIFSEHFLEHVDYPFSAKKIVSECFRILKPKGQIVIGVPDSELAIKSYYNKNKEYYEKALTAWYTNRNCLEHFNTYIDLLNYHFRDQDDDPKYNPHFWAYDFEKLVSMLTSAGFSDVKRWKFDPTIANPKRKWGSIYVIGTK